MLIAAVAVLSACSSSGSIEERARTHGRSFATTSLGASLHGVVAYVNGDGVWVLRLDTMKSRPLIEAEVSPAWSPDGKRIAAVDQLILIHDANGKNAKDYGGGVCDQPAWAPNGREIACVGPTDDRLSNISDKLGLWLEIGGAPYRERLLPVAVTDDAGPTWSPDGTRIAFANSAGAISVLDVTSGKARTLGTGTSPDWSPKGDAIAYSTGRSLVVARPDGRKRRTVVRSRFSIDQPTWSPNGGSIIYAVFARRGQVSLGLRAVRASGGSARVLTRTGYDPDWRPG